jgi:hypothetical protein
MNLKISIELLEFISFKNCKLLSIEMLIRVGQPELFKWSTDFGALQGPIAPAGVFWRVTKNRLLVVLGGFFALPILGYSA